MTEAGQGGLALQNTGTVSAAEELTHPKRSYHHLEASKIPTECGALLTFSRLMSWVNGCRAWVRANTAISTTNTARRGRAAGALSERVLGYPHPGYPIYDIFTPFSARGCSHINHHCSKLGKINAPRSIDGGRNSRSLTAHCRLDHSCTSGGRAERALLNHPICLACRQGSILRLSLSSHAV